MSGDVASAGGAVRLAARALLRDPSIRRRAGVPLRTAGALVEVAVMADQVARERGCADRDDARAFELAVICVAGRRGAARARTLQDARDGGGDALPGEVHDLVADLLAAARAIRRSIDRSSRFRRRLARTRRQGCP